MNRALQIVQQLTASNAESLHRKSLAVLTPIIFFAVAFVAVPWLQFRNLEFMPGDIGDARLNNYFLERVFLWVTGKSDSFWNMDFFFPFPLVGGFSENHFGSALSYVVPRLFTVPPDTSFQLWFLFGYVFNFFAAYYALRKLRIGTFGAAIGGVIFAFALPTSGHAGHAQLHYRWALPLSVVALIRFLEGKNPKWLGVSFLLVVFQFYIGIYSGFFALLLVSSIFSVHFVTRFTWFRRSKRQINTSPQNLRMTNKKSLMPAFALSSAGVVALWMLFAPYLQVSRLYSGSRSWEEISSMLPRPSSYLIADHSTLWSTFSSNFSDIPMRHEHQMFIGLIPLILLAMGAFLAIRLKHSSSMAILGGGFFVVVFSIFINGASLWFLVHQLPLVSVIRAVTRVDQTLLFVAAYGAAFYVNWLLSRLNPKFLTQLLVGTLIGVLLIAEAASGRIGVSEKVEWRERVDNLVVSVPEGLPTDSVLFFAQTNPPWFAAEIDAMWASLLSGRPTLNGYSGIFPPGWSPEYGKDCVELPLRVLYYENWAAERGVQGENYKELFSRVVPIGLHNCQSSWSSEVPFIFRSEPHSAEEFSRLRLGIVDYFRDNHSLIVTVSIANTGPEPIRVNSLGPDSIKLSWAQPPGYYFSSRFSLSQDILPGLVNNQVVRIPLSDLEENQSIEFSIVQELVFWGHDVGVNRANLDTW